MTPTHLDTRQSHLRARSVHEPAPTMISQNLWKGAAVWTSAPALTTTPGTGYKPTKGEPVSVREAATLQSFRPDYPWQGSRRKQLEQVGNAIPPLLARAVLAVLLNGEDPPLRTGLLPMATDAKATQRVG